MGTEHDLALIFTALDTEAAELADSLGRFLDNVDGISSDFICVVVIQRTGTACDLPLPEHSAVEVITTAPLGVSASRNIGLRAVFRRARRIMFADCRTILSRPFCTAAFSDGARQSALWLGHVRWDQIPGAAHVSRGSSPARTLIDIAYEGFLWRCIFQMPLLADCRFREDIGPGTASRIQSGEDCLFMRDVIIANDLSYATLDERALVERLPRHQLALKEQRYAYGAGYRVGQLLRAPFAFRHKRRLALRCTAFLVQSLRLGFSGEVSQRAIARDRLVGLAHGLKDSSKK